jgi:hypothetical protein
VALHPFQTESLEILKLRRVHLALTAPTGAGKGVVLEEFVRNPSERLLLVTPLLALARQQAIRFANRAIPPDRVRIMSPESMIIRSRELQRWRPTLVAVDEAHCLLEWGERFRPAYGKIIEQISLIQPERTLWMSATFPRSLVDLLEEKLPGEWYRLGRFRFPPRLDISFEKIRPSDRIELVRNEVVIRTDPGLVFTGTRQNVVRYLNIFSQVRPFLPYHAHT